MCRSGYIPECISLEAQGDRETETDRAALAYRAACGWYEACHGAMQPCSELGGGRPMLGAACRKLAEIYWDNRVLDPAYQALAMDYWQQGCVAKESDEGDSCRPREIMDPVGRSLAMVAPPAAATEDEMFDAARRAEANGDLALAAAGMRRALALDAGRHWRVVCFLAEIYTRADDVMAALVAGQKCLSAAQAAGSPREKAFSRRR
jgi:hypothetical protein